jgi:CRP-like cAMP-binding protein
MSRPRFGATSGAAGARSCKERAERLQPSTLISSFFDAFHCGNSCASSLGWSFGERQVVAMLGPGDFVGEGCLAGQAVRMATAKAITPVSALVIKKPEMSRVLRAEHSFSDLFVTYMLTRNIRIEEDLVDQLFNSSEKRLARILLLLARYGKDTEPQKVLHNMSQETLAEMVGTTRSRINVFMNKFRKLGFIKYNGSLEINSSLLSVVLRD